MGMIIQYLYHKKMEYVYHNKLSGTYLLKAVKHPYGCLVARRNRSVIEVGWSLCRKDDIFKRKTARQLAVSRLPKASHDFTQLPTAVHKEMLTFITRIERYFKSYSEVWIYS